MEVDTQRVWDYAGDNYVHRLIQTKAGGKLVELPSASTMAASMPQRLWNARYTIGAGRGQTWQALSPSTGGSANATNSQMPASIDEMQLQNKLEALDAEYSSLILSQLDSQRVHYEAKMTKMQEESVSTSTFKQVSDERDKLQVELGSMTQALSSAQSTIKKQDTQLRRSIENLRTTRNELEQEKSLSKALCDQVQNLMRGQDSLQRQMDDVTEQLRDMTFFVSARDKIEQQTDDTLGIAGGDVIVPNPSDGQRQRQRQTHGGKKKA